jgi:hypothetical protein
MVRQLGLAAVMAAMIGCAAGAEKAPNVSMADRAHILNRSEHLLSIVVTETSPTSKQTWYRMDEINLGEGEAGVSNVLSLMKEMKRGAILKIVSDKKFDVSMFEREGERRGILVRPVAK